MNIFCPPTDEELLDLALEDVRQIEIEDIFAEREAGFEEVRKEMLRRRDAGICENCETAEGTKLRPARTSYHYEGDDPDKDPNRDWMGCDVCDEQDREYWDEMWAEYYSGRL